MSCCLFIGQIISNQNTGWKKSEYLVPRIKVSSEGSEKGIKKVKTTLGKIVPGDISANEHFTSLKVAWS